MKSEVLAAGIAKEEQSSKAQLARVFWARLLLGTLFTIPITSPTLAELGCDHRMTTATSLPNLWLSPNIPPEELASSPRTDSNVEPGSTMEKQTLGPVHPPIWQQLASRDKIGPGQVRETEIPCGEAPPPDMVCIPGGPFWRGNDRANADERPRMRVVVSPYFLDVYEVTNEKYSKCVQAGHCDPPIRYYPLFGKPKQPVVAVSWYEAYDYCQFAGKRLPTEAEWEKAARGPDGDIYPWGNEPATCERAVYEEPVGAKGCGTGLTASVGSRPAGRYGVYDLAGNSWEWVDDWKTDCYLGCAKSCGTRCMGPDPKGPCGGGPTPCPGFSDKVLKGGSWFFTADRLRGAERRGVPPSNRGPHRLGFRCARSLSP